MTLVQMRTVEPRSKNARDPFRDVAAIVRELGPKCCWIEHPGGQHHENVVLCKKRLKAKGWTIFPPPEVPRPEATP
jgi:hypothetical protein